MEYKYEPIFGDQSLFDGAPEDAEFAGWFCQEIRWYMILDGKILFSDGGVWSTSDSPYLSSDIASMRRIIKVPTWTKADQLAGKLPEVGAKVIRVDHEDEWCNVIGEVIATWRCAENNESSQTCLRLKDGTLFLVECYSELRPIETPAEKAQRERDEWCNKAAKQLKNLEYNSTLISIYDALKSGELPMPKKGGE